MRPAGRGHPQSPAQRPLALLGAEADADWAMCWRPTDHEIGHRDGLRLRQGARRRLTTLPR